MSWSFFHHGNDKAALKEACRKSFETSAKYYNNPIQSKELLDPIMGIVFEAIDSAIKPKDAYCLKVESSGHAGSDQCYFGVTVTPVYLPHLVDKPD